MHRHRQFAVAIMLCAALALVGAGVTAAEEDSSDVTIDVNDTVVTVESNDTAVTNETLTVSTTDDNDSYADTGDHVTDDDGQVTLAQPNETVSLELAVTLENETTTTTTTLEAADDDEDGESVDEIEDRFEDELDGENETAEAQFGPILSQFVSELRSETDGGIGQMVSSFAVANNPGNAPDHAGPGGDNESEQGPPDHAGPDSDNESEQGPPDHAGPHTDDEADDDSGNGNSGGPPGNNGN